VRLASLREQTLFRPDGTEAVYELRFEMTAQTLDSYYKPIDHHHKRLSPQFKLLFKAALLATKTGTLDADYYCDHNPNFYHDNGWGILLFVVRLCLA